MQQLRHGACGVRPGQRFTANNKRLPAQLLQARAKLLARHAQRVRRYTATARQRGLHLPTLNHDHARESYFAPPAQPQLAGSAV